MSQLAWQFSVVMNSYYSIFNYYPEIFLIAFAAMIYFYHFSCDWNYIIFLTPHYRRKHLLTCHVMSIREFLIIFIWLQTSKESTSSSDINIFGWSILQVISYLMLTILFLLVNTITLTLVLDRTCEFINGMKIPYSTYWTYSQIDVAFDNPMKYLR